MCRAGEPESKTELHDLAGAEAGAGAILFFQDPERELELESELS